MSHFRRTLFRESACGSGFLKPQVRHLAKGDCTVLTAGTVPVSEPFKTAHAFILLDQTAEELYYLTHTENYDVAVQNSGVSANSSETVREIFRFFDSGRIIKGK